MRTIHPIIRSLLARSAVAKVSGLNGPLHLVGPRELVRDGALLVRVGVGWRERGLDVVHGVVDATAGGEAASAQIEEKGEGG